MAYGVGRLFLLTWCLVCCWPAALTYLDVIWKSKELEFVFPSAQAKAKAIQNEYYIPGKSVPIDVDAYYNPDSYKLKIFITIPRFDKGRPITLSTLQNDGTLAAYPDYSWHDNQGKNCAGLTSVFRTAIDNCDRLWVMDAGKIGDEQVCPPKLMAFDLKTDKLVYTHIVAKSKYSDSSLFVTPVVDECGKARCAAPFVYVADVTGNAVMVCDVAKDRSWVVKHRLFYPHPSWGTFTIAGESFDLMDGVLGMALSPCKPGSDRNLYFHALASNTENVVKTSVLKNDSFIRDSNADPSSIKELPGKRPSQSAAEATDVNGNMYSILMNPPSVYMWNSGTKVSNYRLIDVDEETLQFGSGVKVINNLKGKQDLFCLTNSFQKAMTGTLSSNRTNFRIHTQTIPYILYHLR